MNNLMKIDNRSDPNLCTQNQIYFGYNIYEKSGILIMWKSEENFNIIGKLEIPLEKVKIINCLLWSCQKYKYFK